MIDQFCNIIFKVLNYYLSKNINPDLTISNIKELSSDNLDETLRFDKKDIPKCNKEWLEISKKNEHKLHWTYL